MRHDAVAADPAYPRFSMNSRIPARSPFTTLGPTAWSSIAAVQTCTVPQPSRK
jgi:hypothetical protein